MRPGSVLRARRSPPRAAHVAGIALGLAFCCACSGETASQVDARAPGPPFTADDNDDPALDPTTPEQGEPSDGGTDARLDAGSTAAAPVTGFGLDADGVLMIRPPKSGGASFALGTRNPNTAARFEIEQGTTATASTAANVHFWNVLSHPLNYASGGTGYTSRLHIRATGTTQKYTWRTEPGYLSVPSDLKNQELTVYVRAHTVLDPMRAAFTLKVRGGTHTASNGDLASCTMMVLAGPQTTGVARFGKELTHPSYDYVKLTPKSATSLADNAWVGLKLVTYERDATHVVYRLYVDAAPFDAAGKPSNRFVLFSEYVDTANKSTGRYATLAGWGGMQTTFRTDGVKSIDFAVLSVREIVPGT